ncbi:hypothetical protein [uncultured Algibacter sp.]|jgi:hypothetical protein|uniref:hypothetical protein n=1 Tax=uncultured Algibacter sp. TaxID=298659 RepID=UPI00262593AC|nr:hypothetical protein [uncultured Algibacter sp.]|tara:strand:- start:78 stop:446 length:369 start_codon:yes stop_codon:yes gene_type:complete
MAKNKEINKNTKFYKKEMRKWESRISISLTLIMIGIMSFLFIFLKMNDWEFSNITLEAYDLFKFSFLSPFVFYLTFSVRQFNHYKKQLDLYKLKATDFEFIYENKLLERIDSELNLKYKNVS